MKYAIIGDVHSNLSALEAVLADLDKAGGTDEIWCLGDTVGYGPDPHECLEIIRARCRLNIAGNHDLAAIGRLETSTFNQEAATAARWTGHQLTQDEISFLSSLPLKMERDDFTLAHGSPREPVWEYIQSIRDAEENLPYFKTRHCLVGHSHAALYFKFARIITNGRPKADSELSLAKNRFIINPGGVGQPRDSDPRAAYAVYDSQSKTLVFKRVSYDISAVQSRMEKAGLPPWLSERLAYGR
jgi:diadenosine tetraphosphatase ApaH/serine/threonine PP2A family protein phosphatase